MRALRAFVTSTILALTLVPAVHSQDLLPRDNTIFTYHNTPDYRPTESHPLRTVAYVLHPIGWLLREGIYRPFSYAMGSTEFTRSFFGYREPFDWRKDTICFDDVGVIPNCRELPPYIAEVNAVGELEHSEGAEAVIEVEEVAQVYFPDVAFDFDKSSLNALGQGRVRQIAQFLASVPEVDVVLDGNTDYKGSEEYNKKLGEKRADTVMKALVDLGIDPARLGTVTSGEDKPVFTEQADWARAVNRRVVVQVRDL